MVCTVQLLYVLSRHDTHCAVTLCIKQVWCALCSYCMYQTVTMRTVQARYTVCRYGVQCTLMRNASTMYIVQVLVFIPIHSVYCGSTVCNMRIYP